MPIGGQKIKVMFLCTANSCRSQMAEGFARHYGKALIEVHSAGMFASSIHPRAIEVMGEEGIDISKQSSKEIDKNLLKSMDVVITLCGHAEESCPGTPTGIRRIHWPIKDPVGTIGSEETIKREFRRARNEIKKKIQDFLLTLKEEAG